MAELRKIILERFPGLSGGRVLAAVSGGADSTALALALKDAGADFAIAHAHHGMRGADADGDAEAVRALAERLGVPYFRGDLRVPERRRKGESPEMAARRLRRAWLAETASREGYALVATGHTADDQAETLLLRLARGTSPAGLAGIQERAADPRHPGLSWIRPLLGVTHGRLVAWLRARGEPWREDASNRDETIPRNRVRHRLLPALREWLNPRVVEALGRLAELSAAENDLLEAVERVLGMAPGAARDAALAALSGHEALKRRRALAGLWAARAGGAATDMPTMKSVLEAAGKEEDGMAESEAASGTLGIWRIGRNLAGGERVEFRRDELPGDGSPVVLWRDAEGNEILARRSAGFGRGTDAVSLSWQAVGEEAVSLRRPVAGDRLRPVHFTGSKKLSDIFTDAKVPRAERGAAVAVECGGKVAALGGYRVAEAFAVAEGEAAILLEFRRA